MKNKKACLSVFWINVIFIIVILGIALYALYINNPFK